MDNMYISLIGCGKISHRHVSAINSNPSLELLSACDVSSEMRKIFNEKYNVPVFSSVKELVNYKLADIVVVLTFYC